MWTKRKDHVLNSTTLHTTNLIDLRTSEYPEQHKRMAWGCRGCGRIPNVEKLAIIRAKI